MQGCPIFSTEISLHQVLSLDNNPYKIGGDFTGQIGLVRIYKKPINNTEVDYTVNRYICKYTYDAQKMEEVVAWIDFNTGKITNLTALPLQFTTHNMCYVDDAIQAISVSGSDYAYSINSNLNPICTRNRQHAIFMKFFTVQDSSDKQTLFSNGDFDDNDSLIIYLQKCNDSYDGSSIKMKMGLQTVEFSSESYIHDNIWNDLLITFRTDTENNLQVYCYINGELHGFADLSEPYTGKNGNGQVKLGNAFEMNAEGTERIPTPFGGYITTVAVFDQTLIGLNNTFVTTSKPMDFHKNEPFIYEPGLETLYNLDNGNPLELVSGKAIFMSNDIKSDSEEENTTPQSSESDNSLSFIGSVTGTNNSNLETPLYSPYIPSYTYFIEKNSLSKADQRNLDKLGEVIFGYYESALGVTLPEDVQKSFLYSSGPTYLNTPLMNDIKLGVVSAAAIISFFAGMFLATDAAILSVCSVAALVGISLSGFGAALLIGLACAAAAIVSAAVVTGIIYVMKIIIAAIQDINNSNDDDDGTFTIIYDSFSTGATSLTEGRKAALDVSYANQLYVGEPTWTPVCGREGNPSVFVVDKLLYGTITLNIYLEKVGIPLNPTATVTITMEALTPYGNLFNKFVGTKVCIVGLNTIELVSEGYNIPLEDNIFKYETTYNCISTIDGKPGDSMVVKLPMYSIPQTPRKPIGHGKRNAVITEFLDMLSSTSPTHSGDAANADLNTRHIEKQSGSKITNDEWDMYHLLMSNLYFNKNLQYFSGGRDFFDIKNFTVEFINTKNMQKLYEKCLKEQRPFLMNCLEFSVVMTYGINMLNNKKAPQILQMLRYQSQQLQTMTTNEIRVSGLHHQGVEYDQRETEYHSFDFL